MAYNADHSPNWIWKSAETWGFVQGVFIGHFTRAGLHLEVEQGSFYSWKSWTTSFHGLVFADHCYSARKLTTRLWARSEHVERMTALMRLKGQRRCQHRHLRKCKYEGQSDKRKRNHVPVHHILQLVISLVSEKTCSWWLFNLHSNSVRDVLRFVMAFLPHGSHI